MSHGLSTHSSWRLLVAAVLLALALVQVGCRSKVCQKMVECCRKLEDDPKVGQACGRPAEREGDDRTCRTVLETLGYMYEDRDASLPKVCRLDE